MDRQTSHDIEEAGTGFMLTLSDAIHFLEEKGYHENLTARYDHFECRNGQVKIYPNDLEIDKVVRFENTSDPDDQAILYAVRSKSQKEIKGVYVDSYGLYHEELSPEILEQLKNHPI